MNTVVSAAHCVDHPNPAAWRIQAGHMKRFEKDLPDFPGTVQMRQVHKIYKHEYYNRPVRFNNDIMLMVVDPPFDYTDYVRPACLPSPSFKVELGHMIISGVGKTE